MLPYTGGKFVTFRAYVGEGFKDTNLDVQSVLSAHLQELASNVRLIDFSREFCVFSVGNLSQLTNRQCLKLPEQTYVGKYVCTVTNFFDRFFAQEVENAILLDLEQEYRRELGERGEVEAEDRNDYFNCL